MAEEQIPKGQLFTHVYLDRSEPALDSPQFRKRIGSFCQSMSYEYDVNSALAKYLEHEIGIDVPSSGSYLLESFFKTIEVKYLLNAITLIWRSLNNQGFQRVAEDWRIFVQRAMEEENLGYYLDEECGAHYFVDKEFESNRVATLRCLEDSRYSGVRLAFEHAFDELDSTPPHTKDAIRSLFESLEILIKQMVKTKNLNKWIVQNSLKDIALQAYKGDSIAQESVGKVFMGFGDWVDAIHIYRHGQDVPEPKDPPIEFAIYVLSSGASFLRWLVEIDKACSK